jgi:prepilin-type N-terminal cleavage/methylation domain-containing protein
MKNAKQNIRKIGQAGFSLVEMLVVIAVIGVIAAIAIPNIGNINDAARRTTAQRNAQSCASVYSAAIAAGAPTPGTQTVAGALAVLNSSTWTPASGAFEGKIFTVPNLPTDSDAVALMSGYLKWGSNGLEYNPNATPTL